MNTANSIRRAVVVSASIVGLAALPGYALAGPTIEVEGDPERVGPHAGAPEPVRVAGDVPAPVYFKDAGWRFDDMAIPTPLPVGYPAPTPPGAFEIKHYPSVRRAEVSGESSPRMASMQGFWPLFQHISRNDIAMTAPVEMDYAPVDENADNDARPAWTMSFLYYEQDLGPTGNDPADPNVTIRDTEPVTVLATGIKGQRSDRMGGDTQQKLVDWIEQSPEWRIAGEPRWFGYNGPDMPRNRQWSEVQVPVERVELESADVESDQPAS